MEKIKLNDGTVLEIQNGAKEYNISILTDSVDNLVHLFTDENLARYEILTADGSVCAIFTKKHLKKLSAEVTENGYLVTIVLDDVDELYERVKSLEATVEILQAEIEATKEEVVEEPEVVETEVVEPETTTEPEEVTETVEDETTPEDEVTTE